MYVSFLMRKLITASPSLKFNKMFKLCLQQSNKALVQSDNWENFQLRVILNNADAWNVDDI